MFDQFNLPTDSTALLTDDEWLQARYHIYIRNLMQIKAEMAMDPRMISITVRQIDEATGQHPLTVVYKVDNVKYTMNGQGVTIPEGLARCRASLDKKLNELFVKNQRRQERKRADDESRERAPF